MFMVKFLLRYLAWRITIPSLTSLQCVNYFKIFPLDGLEDSRHW